MKRLWGGFALVALSACASGQKVQRPTPSVPASSVSIHQAKRGDERVTPYDLNHDGTPDVWDYTVEVPGPGGKPEERLERRELDMNSDGRVDIVKWYGPREQLSKEYLDLDFDGRIDQVNLYENGLIARKERDLDGDGKPDQFAIYEDGKLVREERDTNGDGKVDVWEYYQNGRLDRVGKDLDGDGKIDQWIEGDVATGNAAP